ncbi:MAG: hypothetical protein WCX97_02560 [Candidatus Magasanikbacteria bacterium]
MSTSNSQTMVTIRKADGTAERISLAELKKRQAPSVPQSSTAVSAPLVSPAKVSSPQKVVVNSYKPKIDPARVAFDVPKTRVDLPPIKSSVRPVSAPVKNDFNDFASPFDNDLPVSKPGISRTSQTHADDISDIIKKLSFRIPDQYQNRLRSIIQLRIKDMRSVDDTSELAARSIKGGGLGITQLQADELIKVIKYHVSDVKKDHLSKSVANNLPMVETTMEPATVTPFNSFVHKTASAFPAPVTSKPKDNIKNNNITTGGQLNSRLMGNFSKPQMNDIIYKPKEMGPMEEILYFTLTDFRRLSDSPTEAASRLWQKFINLKEESILFYFTAIKNWRSSPLYKDYARLMSKALAKKQKLADVIGDGSQIQLAEVKALIEMEKRLE